MFSDSPVHPDSPVFSVIIPTHNRAHLLTRAVQSVLAQTLTHFELIIVDDASTDNTSRVVASIGDERIRYLRHETGRGGGAARNTGIHSATGEYIAFLDDDDEWLPDKLKKQADVFHRDIGDDLGVVVCGSKVQKGNAVREQIPRPRGWVYEDLLAFRFHTTTSTLLVRKSCLDRIGAFDETFLAFQEWDLLLRLSQEYRFDHVDEALHIYHEHDGIRVSHTSNEIRAMQRILDKYDHELQMRPRIMALHHYKLARMYMRTGQLPEARRQMAASLQAAPFNVKRRLIYLLTFLDAGIFGATYSQYVHLSRIKKSLYRSTLGKVRP
jgi:glycosyltransferase involved in cell wall biosynthesis